MSDYADILFAPAQFNEDAVHWSDRYASHFSHDNEEAHTGYYQVYLDDQEINVELTALNESAFTGTDWKSRTPLSLIIDMKHRKR